MGTNHTKGPWYAGTDTNGTNVSTAGHGLICELTSNGCKPLRQAELNQAENRLANAKLIAAAPDLLSALEAVAHGMMETQGFIPNFMEQALKKATG